MKTLPWKRIALVFLSRKFLASAAAVALLIMFHHRTVADLERLESTKASALTTIFITTSGTLGAILIGYLGFNTLQTRFGLSGVAQVMSETREETITQTIDETARNENLRANREE